MVFGKTSLMYEQVQLGDPEGISIDEELLKNTLDKQASSDQKTTQILSQTKTAISLMGRPREGVHHTPGAISTGAALVLLLVTRSSTKPVNFLHIGHECNLPVSRRRLQRYVNRAAQETKIGFYQQVDNDMATATDLTTRDMHIAKFYVYIRYSVVMKSTSWTKIYLSLAKTQQGQLSLNLPDIHLSLINPLVCQMKVLFGRLLSESLGLLPFSSREVNSWAI